ncbi:unnamed protein product, partial [Discosporangium mesarthrocarpum]
RWEKVLVPARRLYRPLLTRLYFKLGVLSEIQGQVDRTVACYQEVSALLGEMLQAGGFGNAPPGDLEGGGLTKAPAGGGGLLTGADSMEQIRGVGEIVHLRLVSNHLHRNMSVEGAVRQLRRHVTSFASPPLSAGVWPPDGARARAGACGGDGRGGGGGGGDGVGAGEASGENLLGLRVVPYRHYAWLSRQYLIFGEVGG